ncbi:MAG: beta-ketoacyl synthase N-terminal-like domain-containing protein, partial [Rhodospirillaceae bacterium]
RLWHAGLPGLDPKLVPDTDPQAVRVARKLRVLAPLVDAAGLELPLSRDCPWGTVVRYWSKLASDDALLALLAGQSVPGDAKADFDAWVAGLPGGALGPDPTSLEDFVLDVKAEDENEAGAQDGVVAPSEWTDPLAALADLWQSGADLYLPRLWPLPLTPRVSIPRHPDPLPEPGADRLEASILASASAPASGASDAAGDQPLRDWLKNLIAVVVQRPAASLPEEAGLAEACGVDSLANEAILAKLSRSVGDVPATLLFSCPTIAALAAWLTRERSEAVAALDLAVEARGAPLKASTTEVPTTERPRHRSPPQPGREPVAVVGLAGRFPGAPDIHSFWQMLKDGVSAISEVPPERWDWQAWAGEKGQGDGGHYTRFGGFLPDPYAFDPLFFAIPPVSAARMDPQQRVMLETAWSALEDAGIRPRDLPRRSGVYIGASTQSFATLAARAAPPPGGKALTVETDLSDIANRISFLMDLHGPSLTVDTACSASLTAVHLALKALAAGDCEAALVGGVNLTLDPLRISQFSDKGMLTPEQLCRPFGDGPGGFVDGEGAVALVLKPLSRAQRDGDRIIALLAGSASNSGGRASAYTVPDPSAQAALVREALDDAGLSAQALTYVECHGTGTKLGDPIELEGLTRAFAPDDVAPGACRIGSLKANIGHLIGAAGIAGLAKLLVQAEQRWIAPSLNAIPANPRLDFAATPFTVAIAGQPWEPATPGAPLVGGVELPTDFGTFHSPNLTTDIETGIGGWSIREFSKAVR